MASSLAILRGTICDACIVSDGMRTEYITLLLAHLRLDSARRVGHVNHKCLYRLYKEEGLTQR